MKRIVTYLFICFTLITLLFMTACSNDSLETTEIIGNKVNLEVNGQLVETDNFKYQGDTYIPITRVAELLGKEVKWDEETNTIRIIDKKVQFEDPNLESVIRKQIGKDIGPILVEDVKDIKELKARNSNIKSLEGIQHLVNLEKLDIYNNYIKDLSPLKSLKKLKFVDFQYNIISDISPIEGIEYNGYGNPQDNTFSIGPKIGQLYSLLNDISKIEEAYEFGNNLLELQPDNFEVNLIMGTILAYKNKYDEAISHLEKAMEYNTVSTYNKALALYELSKCYFIKGDRGKAKDFLQEIIKINLYENFKQDLKWYYNIDLKDWTIKETEHFVFYFQPNTKVKDIDKYVKERELAFYKLNRFFNSKLPKKIDYFIWNSDEDAKKLAGIPFLGFANSELAIIHSKYTQSAGHETTHVLCGNMEGLTRKTGLINEGIAEFFSLSNEDKLKTAKKNIRNSKVGYVSVRELWKRWPGQFKGDFNTYPLAGAFVKYLVQEEGKEKLMELLKDQTYENAKIIYGDRIDELITEFEKLLY